MYIYISTSIPKFLLTTRIKKKEKESKRKDILKQKLTINILYKHVATIWGQFRYHNVWKLLCCCILGFGQLVWHS